MIKDIDEISEWFGSKEILDIKQIIDRGLVNEVYIIETSAEKYILRIDPEEEDLSRFQKEKWCTEIALENGVLTPKIFKIGLRKNHHPYMIMEYIKGEDGDKSVNNSIRIWQTLGVYARKLHSIPVSEFGGDMDSSGIFKDNWFDFLDYNISQLTPEDKVISLCILSFGELNAVKQIFEDLSNIDLKFGLTHHDLAPKNTIVSSEGDIYLIDWGSASVLPIPYFDIAEILDESLDDNSDFFKTFLNGYGLSYTEYLSIKPLVNQLNLLMYMDKLRWAVHKRQKRIKYFANQVKNGLKKVI